MQCNLETGVQHMDVAACTMQLMPVLTAMSVLIAACVGDAARLESALALVLQQRHGVATHGWLHAAGHQ